MEDWTEIVERWGATLEAIQNRRDNLVKMCILLDAYRAAQSPEIEIKFTDNMSAEMANIEEYIEDDIHGVREAIANLLIDMDGVDNRLSKSNNKLPDGWRISIALKTLGISLAASNWKSTLEYLYEAWGYALAFRNDVKAFAEASAQRESEVEASA